MWTSFKSDSELNDLFMWTSFKSDSELVRSLVVKYFYCKSDSELVRSLYTN